jgi:hypothetical protein
VFCLMWIMSYYMGTELNILSYIIQVLFHYFYVWVQCAYKETRNLSQVEVF